jgi:hypothetical protein
MIDKAANREKNGRFAKGSTGNTRGRPPKAPRAFLPMQHELDFLFAMEKEIPIVGADGQRTERPAVLVLIDRAIASAIKDPNPKTIITLLDRYLKILEKNRINYLQEEDSLKHLESAIAKASGKEREELLKLEAYLKWKTRRH